MSILRRRNWELDCVNAQRLGLKPPNNRGNTSPPHNYAKSSSGLVDPKRCMPAPTTFNGSCLVRILLDGNGASRYIHVDPDLPPPCSMRVQNNALLSSPALVEPCNKRAPYAAERVIPDPFSDSSRTDPATMIVEDYNHS